jgi:hypothetical protein
MKWRFVAIGVLIAFILFIQACGQRPPPQDSCNFVQNSEAQRVSWKGRVPVKLHLHSSVPPQSVLPIEAAIDEWTRRLGHPFLQIELTGVSGPAEPNKDGSSMIYWLRQWESDRRTEQARTTVYWTGSRIYEADIRVNAQNFLFYNGDGSEIFSGVDLVSLMVHEFGHVLGLSHNEAAASVMATTLASGTLRRVPSKTDLDSIHCEY